jgi:phosphoenolpyruvate carboxylase
LAYGSANEDSREGISLAPVLSELSQKSRERYQSLVEAPDLGAFFRQVTPVDVIEQSKIGSRPARRTGAQGIEDLRAIPWVFSWTQSRFFLSGWFGVGTALHSLKSEQPLAWASLRENFMKWPPTAYLFTNVETTIMSASEQMMRLYGTLVTQSDLRERFLEPIIAEFQLTKAILAELFPTDFRTRRPRMAKTLELREPVLEVLHRRQVEKLAAWRNSHDPELLSELLLVTNALAGGLRTTG